MGTWKHSCAVKEWKVETCTRSILFIQVFGQVIRVGSPEIHLEEAVLLDVITPTVY
jgi:hypothetical protein